ncbi:hypothetical protein TRFO_29707 [Tritrichomonas foetus]|uniref:Uncharacterized protein n=1 Tax=Tritrichomonas foetus TaxID=1144522 RepID=A0A1J4JVG5_9EUKA|nr:hypothetical protein TRFO_29707 [Tritrichomonas foetus]|eukprot:OHT03003.1 hypothetical protein TRFO_29707 [Tritrichomonas foetus]
MIADPNQTFQLNACKKVVRLSKLIEAFSVEAQDRCDQINQVHTDFQHACQAIVDRFNRESAKISRDLNQFRKDYISDTCSNFSEEYKTIKRDFTKYKNGQIRKLNAIIVQSKGLQQAVQLIQNSTLKTATDTLTSASEMEENLQNHNSPEYMETFIKPHIQPILDKMERYVNYSDDRLRRMKKRYDTRADSLREASQMDLKNYYRMISPAMEILRGKIKELKANIFDSKMHLSRLVEQNKAKMRFNMNSKNSFLRETNYICKELDDKLFLMLERQKTVLNTNQNQIRDLQNQLQTKQRNKSFKLDFIDKMIAEKERQYKALIENWDSEMEKKIIEINNQNHQVSRKSRSLAAQKTDEIQTFLQQCKEIETDSNELIDKLRRLINESITFSQKKSAHFNLDLREQETRMRHFYKSSKDKYTIHRRGRLFVLQKAMNLQISSILTDCDLIKAENQQARKNLQLLKASLSKQLSSINNEYKTKLDDFTKSLNDTKTKKMNENETEYNDVLLKNKNDFNRFSNNFTKEVQSKQKHINNMINIKVNQYKLSLDHSDPANPTDPSVIEKLQQNLGKIDSDIKVLMDQHNKVIDGFESQTRTLAKLIRKFQRNKQSETSLINGDYEMKIQVAQVQLKEKLENLSKIYDPDENQRGCDIIEAFRKVREVRFTMNDAIVQIKKEHELAKKELSKKCQNLTEKINWYKTAEKTLSNQYKTINDRANIDIPELQKVQKQEILPLQTLISELKQKFNNELNAGEIEKKKLNSQFQQQANEIENTKKQINNKYLQQIKQIDQTYSVKINKLNNDHKKEVDLLKAQISNAKKELVNMNKTFKGNSEKEFVSFCNKLKQNISLIQTKMRGSFDKENQVLDTTINERIKKLIQFDLLFCNVPLRRADKKKIEILRSSLSELDNKTAIEFNTHAYYIKQPAMIQQQQQQQKNQTQKQSRSKSVRIILESTYPGLEQKAQQIV